MERRLNERAEVEAERRAAPTPSDRAPQTPSTDTVARPRGGSTQSPSGIDDPANLNAYQGEPETAPDDDGA